MIPKRKFPVSRMKKYTTNSSTQLNSNDIISPKMQLRQKLKLQPNNHVMIHQKPKAKLTNTKTGNEPAIMQKCTDIAAKWNQKTWNKPLHETAHICPKIVAAAIPRYCTYLPKPYHYNSLNISPLN